MIPKIIHYCWFGGKALPEAAQKCIDSWNKYLPEYQIVRWDEETFDINSNIYVKEAYESKKYAFVTDYVRLYAIYTVGGIYMDTDVEVCKPLDAFLKHKAFSGFENFHDVPTGIMASEKGNPTIKDLLDYYTDRHFIKEDGNLDTTTNVVTITNYFKNNGLKRNNTYQTIRNFTFYPRVYFCPSHDDIESRMDEIYTIHHMQGSWLSEKEKKAKNGLKVRCKKRLLAIIKKILGVHRYEKLRKWI